MFSYSYLDVLFKVNNIHINLCCRSSVMNVSGGTIYSMYKQENYINKKLDPQKKKSVHKNAKEPCCTTDDTYKVHFSSY